MKKIEFLRFFLLMIIFCEFVPFLPVSEALSQEYDLFFIVNGEFENNLGDWQIAYGNRVDGIPIARGTAEWSSNYGGSAHLTVDGSPSGVSLITYCRTVLFPGDKIKVGLYHTNFVYGVQAGINVRGGSFGEQVSTKAAAPEEDIELIVEIKNIHLPGTPIELWLVSWPGSGEAWFKYVRLERGGNVTKIKESQKLPESLMNPFQLYQNYPNPFNSVTVIEYFLTQNSDIQLQIYDNLGRLIKTLYKGSQVAGNHKIVWDGTDNMGKPVSSGVYFYSIMDSKGHLITKKSILIK